MPIPYHVWSPFSTILLDPFVLFCLGCLVTPLIVESTYNEDVALCDVSLRGFNDQTAGLWKAYWTDTAVLCAAAYAVVAVLIASDYPCTPRKRHQRGQLVPGQRCHYPCRDGRLDGRV